MDILVNQVRLTLHVESIALSRHNNDENSPENTMYEFLHLCHEESVFETQAHHALVDKEIYSYIEVKCFLSIHANLYNLGHCTRS